MEYLNRHEIKADGEVCTQVVATQQLKMSNIQ